MGRQLTEKEQEIIKNYKLHPQVGQVVWEIWSKGEKPAEVSSFKKFSYLLISAVIILGSSVILWLNYFSPSITYMPGALNIVIFFFWLMFPLMAVVMVVQVIMIEYAEKEAFKKYALDMWYKKNYLHGIIFGSNQFVLVIGLVVNGYIFSAVMATICLLIIYFAKIWIRFDVQQNMDKVIKCKESDVDNTEFSST